MQIRDHDDQRLHKYAIALLLATVKGTRMIILETERLILRLLLSSDLDSLFALYRDPDIRRYFPEGTLNYQETKEELDWFLKCHPAHPELGLWATIAKDTNQFIGRCGLLPWTIDGRFEVEVAYLLDKAYWGQGLATEAAQALVRYGFDQLHLSRLICLIDPANQASIRVATKLGMRFEKEAQDEKGPYVIYSINKHSDLSAAS
jgi:RimJ/RimL family protein N-acetyltransferase